MQKKCRNFLKNKFFQKFFTANVEVIFFKDSLYVICYIWFSIGTSWNKMDVKIVASHAFLLLSKE